MKKIILAILLIISTVMSGQDCKYKRNEVDEFTKKKVLETNFEWLGENLGYALKKINDTKYLKFEINYSSVFAVREGAKIMFLTEKEEPITMFFPESSISKVSSLTNFYIITFINISDEIYQRLSDEKISKIRIYTTDGYVDKEIKEKRANKFKELLKCI